MTGIFKPIKGTKSDNGARTHQNNKIMALDNGLQYQLQKLSISTAKFGMAKPEAGRVNFDSIRIESK